MNTGGPAFPFVCDADFDYGTGMTLRDYFAAKAMGAYLTYALEQNAPKGVVATAAYKMADAMLKARDA
jgi:hypothetical protein